MRVGFIVPSANTVAERELRDIFPPSISLHVTRLALNGSEVEDLKCMVSELESAVSLLADARVDLIVFHCTAVSTFSDEMEISLLARAAKVSREIPVVTTANAIMAMLDHVQARRIALITPYIEEITRREIEYFRRRGLVVVSHYSDGVCAPHEMAAIAAEYWAEKIRAHASAEVDAYLLSCNGIHSLSEIAQLEVLLGKPVITSNTAAAHYCLTHRAHTTQNSVGEQSERPKLPQSLSSRNFIDGVSAATPTALQSGACRIASPGGQPRHSIS